MNSIFITGFLGRDSASRETAKGGKFLSFTVGSNDFVNGNEKTQWFDCIWFNYNTNMAEHLKKGASVVVVGSLDVDLETADDGKTYIRRKVNVHNVTFNSSGKKEEGEAAPEKPATKTQPDAPSPKKTSTPPADEELVVTTEKKKFEAEESTNSDLPF